MNYLGKIKPSVSGCGNARRSDKLSLRIKGKREYLYAITDDQTKFLIAQQAADSKYFTETAPMLKEANSQTKYQTVIA